MQATGKVNKGIRDTLRSDSAMFMAYNNGISTIAEQVVIDENDSKEDFIIIKELVGWQIVNGGQTTASIYAAFQNKVDLSNVNVQMKLTVIKSTEQMDSVISNISKFANSQNKITMSDLVQMKISISNWNSFQGECIYLSKRASLLNGGFTKEQEVSTALKLIDSLQRLQSESTRSKTLKINVFLKRLRQNVLCVG